jgi:hypothetical protein
MDKLHEFNHLKPSNYYQYHQVLILESLHFAHPVYLRVSSDSYNKQHLVTYIGFTDLFNGSTLCSL